jgi:HlyD family secretion protein
MRRRRIIIWSVLALILIAGFIIWRSRSTKSEIVLQTEKPHYGYIANTVTATGTVQPTDTVAVGTQVSGTIKKVYADFNSKVSKGQLLAELDKTILSAQLQQSSAGLTQARSQLTFAQSNLNRQQQLYGAGAISKAELETAQNEYRTAQASVQSVSSQIQAAQKNLSLANIYSPIDGTVLSRNVSEGQTVAASFNTPTLFSIAKDLTKMQVRAAVDEADIGNVKLGQRVSFTVDAFPDDVFNGNLQEIRLQPSVSSNVVTYTTIITTSNDQLKLKPGMTANITIYTAEENNALLVSAKATKYRPDSSLMKKYTIQFGQSGNGKRTREATSNASTANSNNRPIKDSLRKDSSNNKRASVWLLIGNTIVRKSITTGLSDGTQVQVLSGLTQNDEVIDGIQQTNGKSTSTTERSPFMPQRRTNNNASGGGRTTNRPAQ